MKKKFLILASGALLLASCGGISYTEISKDDPNYQSECENALELVAEPLNVSSMRMKLRGDIDVDTSELTMKTNFEITAEFDLTDGITTYVEYDGKDGEATLYFSVTEEMTVLAYSGKGKSLSPNSSTAEVKDVDIKKEKVSTTEEVGGLGSLTDFDLSSIKSMFVADEFDKLEKSKDGDYRITINEQGNEIVGEILNDGKLHSLSMSSHMEVGDESMDMNMSLDLSYDITMKNVNLDSYTEVSEEDASTHMMDVIGIIYNGLGSFAIL